MIGTHAERMPINPTKIPNGIVFFETDTKVSVIALNGIWEPFSAGVLALVKFGHATILAGQGHVDVAIAGITIAADPVVGINQAAVDTTLKSVQSVVPVTGTLRIIGNANATADVVVTYFVPSVV